MMISLNTRFILLFSLLSIAATTRAQFGSDLQFFRPPSKAGLNQFEPPKTDTTTFTKIKVRVGGDFALQFQGLSQTNAGDTLVDLGSDLNLPTANLNLNVQLADGVRMHLRTYLSSRHHSEAWVKGGHLRIDKLDFIRKGFLEGLMRYTTLTVGLDEVNYGDAHFRRTDNASAIYNPFVGNYIMDSFTTEAFADVNVQVKGFLMVLGVSNGKLNQSVVVNDQTDNALSFFGKLGYDGQVSEDLRVRLTGSWYINHGSSTGTWLYGGDRAGGRYYSVYHSLVQGGSDFEPRVNARFTKITAIQVNPFVKFKGLEFFGIYELAAGAETGDGSYTQLAGELLFRFGKQEQFYLGGRYNTVSGKSKEVDAVKDIARYNVGGGWFMTPNILAKVEYVAEERTGPGWEGTKFAGAAFNGIMVEAAISF